jgi:hypothetical protein
MNTHQPRYTDHDLIGQDRKRIGTVTDVLFDGRVDEPKWLVVKPGLLHSGRLVPLDGSYTTEDGDIVVPFDKKWVMSAPKAGGGGVLPADIEQQASRHYGVSP